MRTNPFGNTGLAVSQLGAGLARIGYELTLRDIDEAGWVLNAALDGGVNFLDTSACYDISEELIGRTISHRRGEFILATKLPVPEELVAELHRRFDLLGVDWLQQG